MCGPRWGLKTVGLILFDLKEKVKGCMGKTIDNKGIFGHRRPPVFEDISILTFGVIVL